MSAGERTPADPTGTGRAHDPAAWQAYWRTHGYEPVGLDETQASAKAVELSRRASAILERERLDLHEGSAAPIEMRRWGEEVCFAADAPHGSQCLVWIDVEDTDPEELEAIVAEELLHWRPDTTDERDRDDEAYFHAAGRRLLEHADTPAAPRPDGTTIIRGDPVPDYAPLIRMLGGQAIRLGADVDSINDTDPDDVHDEPQFDMTAPWNALPGEDAHGMNR